MRENTSLPPTAASRRAFLRCAGQGLVAGAPFWALGKPAWAVAEDVPSVAPAGSAAPSPKPAAEDLLDGDLRPAVQQLFEELCEWVMTLDLAGGTLKLPPSEPRTFIWVNGNLARVLISSHKILDRPVHRAEALRWLDHLADQQQPTATATGEPAGYWGDNGPRGNIYLADTGTALTAMALGYPLADGPRQQRYRAVMERFARFVRFGCREDPQGQGREATATWLIEEGKDRGALGCGYYRGHLSTAPYIISTAITRCEFLSLLGSINGDPELAPIVAAAVRWILAQRLPSGELPYLIDGIDPANYHWPLDTMTYCGEGLIAAYVHQNDPALRRHIAAEVKPCVEWLLRTKRANGAWGEMGSQDQQRSPGCVTLLAWYYRTIEADPRIARSIRSYCRFLLDPAQRELYGFKRLVRTTGFIGLVLADLLQPGVTFG